MNTLSHYFPDLSAEQQTRFAALTDIYSEWNSRINVISRKDLQNFEIHHLLHSLSIARITGFSQGNRILDVGTGGGFPGIPLAILFPEAEFFLLDSIDKKIRVVTAVAEQLRLMNVRTLRKRAEDEKGLYDFVISRAVAPFHELVRLTSGKIRRGNTSSLGNGLIALKGGELGSELRGYETRTKVWNIAEFFKEPFFETKKIVYLPV